MELHYANFYYLKNTKNTTTTNPSKYFTAQLSPLSKILIFKQTRPDPSTRTWLDHFPLFETWFIRIINSNIMQMKNSTYLRT